MKNKKKIRNSHPQKILSYLEQSLALLRVLETLRDPRPFMPPGIATAQQKTDLKNWDQQQTVLTEIRKNAVRATRLCREITEFNDQHVSKRLTKKLKWPAEVKQHKTDSLP